MQNTCHYPKGSSKKFPIYLSMPGVLTREYLITQLHYQYLLIQKFCLRCQTSIHLFSLLPAVQETWVWSLGWEDPLEKEIATHSSILAWKIPWTEEPGGLQSMSSQQSGTTEQLTLIQSPGWHLCRVSSFVQLYPPSCSLS